MDTALPTHPIYPAHDLDLNEIAQRDDDALPIVESLMQDIKASGQQPDEAVMLMLNAVNDRHTLLIEIANNRRDRDSARTTILRISSMVPRWRTRYIADGPNTASEFGRGLAAAADTIADLLVSSMVRD